MPPANGKTASLCAVDVAAAAVAWRKEPLDRLVKRAPRGRLAAVMAGPVEGIVVDGGRPAAEALETVSLPGRRQIFDAMVEDLAEAWLWDVPVAILADVFATLARVARRKDLEAAHLDASAAPAYPSELLDEPFVEVGGDGGLSLWLSDPSLIAAAAAATRRALALPPGSFSSSNPELFADVLEALLPVLDAARPGYSIAMQRT